MVRRVKKYKAGFVVSDSNVRPGRDAWRTCSRCTERTGPLHHRRHRGRHARRASSSASSPAATTASPARRRTRRCRDLMTPFETHPSTAREGIEPAGGQRPHLEAQAQLPARHRRATSACATWCSARTTTSTRRTRSRSWTTDKRLIVGAGINTRDYARARAGPGRGRRRRALHRLVRRLLGVAARDASQFVKEHVRRASVRSAPATSSTREGFRYLAEAGADFVKVGIGGGSICITREQKGIGRGQATAVIEVAQGARRVLPGDRHLRADLLRRRHRAGLPHHAGARHGRGLRDDGPLLRPLRRGAGPQGCASTTSS